MRRVALLIGLLSLAIFLMVKPPILVKGGRGIEHMELTAPAGKLPVHINPTGETVLPNGRLISPLGVQVTVQPHPYGMALSPDGKLLVTANTGTWPFSLSIISALGSNTPEVRHIPPGYPFKYSDVEPSSVYMGLAIAGDSRTAYVSEGDTGNIDVYDLQNSRRLKVIRFDGLFNGKDYRHSFAGALALSGDGGFSMLWILHISNWSWLKRAAGKFAGELRSGGCLSPWPQAPKVTASMSQTWEHFAIRWFQGLT